MHATSALQQTHSHRSRSRSPICSAGTHPLESTFDDAHATRPDVFHVWLSADPYSNYRVWFHFSVTPSSDAVVGKPLHIVIKNLNNKKPLYGAGMRPVCRRASETEWTRVEEMEFVTLKTDQQGVYSFLRPADADTSPTNMGSGGGGGDGGDDEDGGDAQPGSGSSSSSEDEDPSPSSPASSPSHSRSTSQTDGTTAVAKTKKKQPVKKAGASASSSSSSASSKSKSHSKSSKSAASTKHDTMELTIIHTLTSHEEVFFAFCLPQSYTELQSQLRVYDRRFAGSREVYFHRELLTHSLEGRRIDLVTISSHRARNTSELEPDLTHLYPTPTSASARDADITAAFPHDSSPAAAATAAALATTTRPRESRSSSFAATKPVAFVSSRVHPGESPSAYMLHGVLEFVLSSDPRAVALRDAFVLKVVPCLNPDGVAHGYYRTDTLGQNLNRYYESPDHTRQPAIHATRAFVASYHARGSLFFYLDLHAHATKRGLFLFGNALPDPTAQARNLSYARLVALNSSHLALGACNFTRANMRAKDARDGLSKEGAGRVAFYSLTGLTHCYTCEVNYHNGRAVTPLEPLPRRHTATAASTADTESKSAPSSAAAAEEDDSLDLSWQREEHLDSQQSQVGPPVQYGSSHFRSMGRALLVGLLDLVDANPFSRLPSSPLVDRDGLDRWARSYATAPPKRILKRFAKKSSANGGTTVAAGANAAAAVTTTPTTSKTTAPKSSPKQSPRTSPRA